MLTRFKDRREAGRCLARALGSYENHSDSVVLALPRGGVPVGYEVAARLKAPLHAFLVRKLGVPGHDEYAMGAMASGGVILLNEEVVRQLGISNAEVKGVVERETRELGRREEVYGKSPRSIDLRNRTVILVDDGLATGSTMKVAVQAVRKKQPRQVIVAVPVAPLSALAEFEEVADRFVCVLKPEAFFAVGEWYVDFDQTTDDEVRGLLHDAALNLRASPQFVPLPMA